MKIDSLAVGPIGTNCYILQDEKEKVCAIIDPGDEAERIEKAIENTGCTPVMILLTHGHFDHCTAVRDLLERWPDLPVYIHESDVTDRVSGGFDLLFPRLTEKNQRYYGEGDCLKLGGLTIRVLRHRSLSGLRVLGGGGCDFLRGHAVLRQLWPHRLCRRQLRGHSPLPKKAGAAARTVHGLPATTGQPIWTLSGRMNPYMKQGLRG